MKKYLTIGLKVVFSMILLMPVIGAAGLLPPPTQDLYNTTLAFAFIEMLTQVGYITYIMSLVHVIALVCLWAKREALAALLILPITVNVVGFHAFIDGGLLTGGAVLGNIMLLINLYLLWENRAQYKNLLGAPAT